MFLTTNVQTFKLVLCVKIVLRHVTTFIQAFHSSDIYHFPNSQRLFYGFFILHKIVGLKCNLKRKYAT
jgi:hypothetical protein